MIQIEAEHLPVLHTEGELDHVDYVDLEGALRKCLGNLVYLVTGERLYGIVSFGDVQRALLAGLAKVPVNRQFTSLDVGSHMKAREMFREKNVLCEIPVVEDGRLVGEFDRYDEVLLLELERDWKYNRYAPQLWRAQGRIGLVRPVCAGRQDKQRLFDRMKERLQALDVPVLELEAWEVPGRSADIDLTLYVDEQEKRGAKFLHLLMHHEADHKHVRTYQDMSERMGSSEVINYGEVARTFREQGVDFLLLTMEDTGTEYNRAMNRAMHERYPKVNNDLNKLMRQYDKAFFDDQYTPDFAHAIEHGYFVVEQNGEKLRLSDTTGPYVNIKGGERRTVGQPEDFTRTVFFFGPCLTIGSYVSDEWTLESCLQRLLNEKGYKVRVVNYGSWGGNIACIGRMASSLIRKGDIVVALLEDLTIKGVDTLNLWDVLEKDPVPSDWLLDNILHCNHHVMERYARAIFDRFFGEGYRDNEERLPVISHRLNVVRQFYTDKYFYGCEFDENEQSAGLVINGNPFTNGHMALVERASREMDRVVVFSVMENTSIFSYGERFAMASRACAHLPNVTVVPSGLFMGNRFLFPAYYAKMYTGTTHEQAITHNEAFGNVARGVHINHRYVGEEPTDPITREINKTMGEVLPRYGVTPVEIPRACQEGDLITGTRVRELAAQEDEEAVRRLVPPATADIIFCKHTR